MTCILRLSAALLAAALLGCRSYPAHDPEHELHNSWVVAELSRASIRQALVEQRTLFPYQFEPGSAALNPLGERDLDVLAEHLQHDPAPLHVRRGDASDELYGRRIATVRAGLTERGVDAASVRLTDEMASSPGTWSETVLSRTRAGTAMREGEGERGIGSSSANDGGSR